MTDLEALPEQLLTHVQMSSGPITLTDLLPGMQIRLQQSADGRNVTGEVISRTLKGLTVYSATAGSISLSDTTAAPIRSWSFTLLRDFDEQVLFPGTCARGVSLRGEWQGLWLCGALGRWEPVRAFDGRTLTVDRAELAPVQLHEFELEQAPAAGDLALVDVGGEQVRGIRWDGVWRLPAVNFTASARTVLPLAGLRG